MTYSRQTVLNIAFAFAILILAALQYINKPVKLAYVENAKVLESYKVMQTARAQYKQQSEGWQANLDSLQQTVQQELDAYNQRKATLSATERRGSEETLVKRQQQYFSYKKAVTEKAAVEEARLMQEVVQKADAFMRAYGKDHGYDIVFAATEAGTIVYGKTGVDITDEVIKALNK